jgi:hypothetical protein
MAHGSKIKKWQIEAKPTWQFLTLNLLEVDSKAKFF